MVQSPSWEANWFAASQEIPRISRNPKVHYRTHKFPPTVAILDQPNPVHIPTSHLLEIHPNIIHTSTPRSPQWSLSLRFPQQEPIQLPLLTHKRHMPSPSLCAFLIIITKTNDYFCNKLTGFTFEMVAVWVPCKVQTGTVSVRMVWAAGILSIDFYFKILLLLLFSFLLREKTVR